MSEGAALALEIAQFMSHPGTAEFWDDVAWQMENGETDFKEAVLSVERNNR
jgi:hypothetical protein